MGIFFNFELDPKKRWLSQPDPRCNTLVKAALCGILKLSCFSKSQKGRELKMD